MYSLPIIEQNVERVEAYERKRRANLSATDIDYTSNFRIVRFTDAVREGMIAHLATLLDSIDSKTFEFTWKRALTREEKRFIDNEMIVCQLDWRYYNESYVYIKPAVRTESPEGWDALRDDYQPNADSGPLVKFKLNGMQEALLLKLAELEELAYDQAARGVPVNGILLILLKARQLGACLVKGTRVLTSDLRWVPIESVKVGDKLVSLDEFPPGGKGPQRKMCVGEVEAVRALNNRKTLRVNLADGRSFTSTPEHRFLCAQRGGSSVQWREVGTMVSGDLIRNLVEPWSEPDYEDGWFGGLLDGEGSLRGKRYKGRAHSGVELSVSQVAGDVLERAAWYLVDSGIKFREEVDRRVGSDSSSKLGDKPVHKLVVGRVAEIFRLIGLCRPSRFVNSTHWWEEKELPTGDDRWAEIVSVEVSERQKVYDLQTSTKTFIAEGLVSHNSTFWQSLIRHRVNFYSYINALVASMDDQSTQSLQRRSDTMYEKLPFWMRAPIRRKTTDRGIVFENGSVIELQDSRQTKDLGKGETWHLGHITECSTFDRPDDHFEEGFFPAIDFSKQVLVGMESTAKGKLGYWYEFVTQVMSGTAEGGAGRFSEFFAPFYLIDIADDDKSKYRLEPPIDWEPAPPTLLIAQKVLETSAQFTVDKRPVHLPKEVLYWYERTRAMYYRRGKLNIFMQSYPVTPEEAFQHGASGAFSNETIERMDLNCSRYEPVPYKLIAADEVPQYERGSSTRPIHHVGSYHLAPMQPEELDRDPRGILWFWEQPHPSHEYVCAGDPTGGIPGWSRDFRQHNDVNTDNACAGVFRKSMRAVPCEKCSGRGWNPTTTKGITVECYDCDGRGKTGGRPVQCVEFAAPIDADDDFPVILYVLSTLFAGRAEFDQCLTIIEGNNTGILTIRKLLGKFSHQNLYQHRTFDGMSVKYLNGYGFASTPTSVPILHARSRSIIVRRNVEVRSRWMVKELSDAVVKITGAAGDGEGSAAGGIRVTERFYVPPGAGRHDDRMTMLFLALWALFDLFETPDSDTAQEGVNDLPAMRDYAATDATAGQQAAAWDRAVEVMAGDQDFYFGHFPGCDITCRATHAPDEEELELERWAEGDADDEDYDDERWGF